MVGMLELAENHRPVAKLIASELEMVQDLFDRQLASELPAVNELCRHVERYRGKMLRPMLTLLSGLATASCGAEATPESDIGNNGALTGAHRVLAAVCEMIHMATLVHDDVLDEAELRRQGITVNYLQGNETAVLLGDYLISNAFHLCSTLGRPEINERIGEVTNCLCAGELLQLHHRDDWSLDERTYLEIIERKTASLIGLCCELGAAESGADAEAIGALGAFGRRVGTAFQIQDDVLDLIGNQAKVGKSLGKDLEKGKLTLPVILYLIEAPAPERAIMLKLLADKSAPDRVRRVARMLTESGAIRRARAAAEHYVSEAKKHLVRLPASPTRDLLADMADAVVNRTQ